MTRHGLRLQKREKQLLYWWPAVQRWPAVFDGSAPVRLDGEPVTGVRRVLHLKLFHPLNDHYGLSPIEAAATAIDIHNAAPSAQRSK